MIPKDHLNESNMTYGKHLWYAASFALTLAYAALVVLLHGLWPSVASHWQGRALIIDAYRRLPHADDKDL